MVQTRAPRAVAAPMSMVSQHEQAWDNVFSESGIELTTFVICEYVLFSLDHVGRQLLQ